MSSAHPSNRKVILSQQGWHICVVYTRRSGNVSMHIGLLNPKHWYILQERLLITFLIALINLTITLGIWTSSSELLSLFYRKVQPLSPFCDSTFCRLRPYSVRWGQFMNELWRLQSLMDCYQSCTAHRSSPLLARNTIPLWTGNRYRRKLASAELDYDII